MNQSEMILEFIDGTLDGGREQRLFDEMARHPELRAELRQYVMIGDAVRSDREAFSPPADVERRLLGGLGLLPVMEAGGATAGAALGAASVTTGGTAATAGVASTFGWLALAKLKSALLPLVVGLILGSAAGGGGVYLAMENTSGSNVNVASAGGGGAEKPDTRLPQVSPSGGEMATATPSSPSRHSASSANRITAASPDQVMPPSATAAERDGTGDARRAAMRDRGPVLSKDSENGNTADGQEIIGGGGNDGSPNSPSVPSVSRSLNRSVEASVPQVDILLIDEDDLLPEEPVMQRSPATLPAPVKADRGGESARSTLALELRKGFVSQPFADNHAREVAADFLREDLVAACFYSPSEDWYFGLEGGRERFAQSLFYNQGDTLFVEQRPALMWGGFALGRRVTAFDLPFFLQGTLGASQYGGPMARGRVGLNVAELFGRSSAFSLPLSFEASSLVYTYNGQYLVTGNWGISGGVQLHFGL